MRWIVAYGLLMLTACSQSAPPCPPCPSLTCATPSPRALDQTQRKRIDDDLAKAQQKIQELKK